MWTCQPHIDGLSSELSDSPHLIIVNLINRVCVTETFISHHSVVHLTLNISKSGLVISISRGLSSKLRGPGFKSQPGIVGGLVTIIMWCPWPD